MKKLKGVVAFSFLTAGIALASCGGNGTASTTTGTDVVPTTTTDAGTPTSTTTQNVDEDKVEYRVCVQALSGKPLKAVSVTLSNKSGTYQEYTDSKGYASFEIKKGTYSISVEELPGYTVNEDYENLLTDPTASELVTKVVMDTHLITADEEEEPDQPTYTEGDIMYDTTFTDVDGNKYQLSDLFDKQNKELVILNFWYTTCSWCVTEFPYLEAAYQKLSDKVEVIAMNVARDDSAATAKAFMEEYNLTMPCVMDVGYKYQTAINLAGCPTSVFIDRYGNIAKIEEGALTTESKWTGAMNQYLGDDYVPTYTQRDESGEAIMVKPTTEYPGDDALYQAAAASGFTGKFSNETDEDDAEYNWPWVVAKDGSICASNSKIDSSYSIFYLDITIPEDKVLACDYKSSTEGDDCLYAIYENKTLFKCSDIDSEYQTAYLYVANRETKLHIGFCYLKDSGSFDGDDTVYLKNFRLIDVDEVSTPTYVIRDCAQGEYNEFEGRYPSYVEAKLGEDGFYYTADGKAIYAKLLDTYTKFAAKSVYEYCLDGVFNFGDVDYTDLITQYSNYASNSTIAFMNIGTSGLVPLTEELKAALVRITTELGESEEGYEEQWQELCCYIDMYAVEGNPLADTIKGLAPFTAYTAVEGHENQVTFDRPIMPRGLYMEFIPTRSGVFNIYSLDEQAEQDCWIYDENGKRLATMDAYTLDYREIYELEYLMRHGQKDLHAPEFLSYLYLEEGHKYYIVPAFADLYTYKTITVGIDYIGTSLDIMKSCSYPAFTTANDDMTGDIISVANIKVALGDDGYYHPVVNGVVVEEDFIYADFSYTTGPFDEDSLTGIISKGGFDFTVNEDGDAVEGKEDKTDKISNYLALVNDDENSIYFGTVKVDEELAELLQELCDKYLFEGVDGAWLKVCYYVAHLG